MLKISNNRAVEDLNIEKEQLKNANKFLEDELEGAKELLDEVMKEGGATQRKRAEALLAKLG